MDLARPLIEERMQQYEGNQIQFNLLALCKSPLISIPLELAVNVKTLSAVENQLSCLQSDWKQFIGESESDSVIHGPNSIYKLTQELLCSAQVPKTIMTQLVNSTTTAQNLFQLRQELIAAQAALRAGMIDEELDIEQDNERALSRRNDYTPMIHVWLRFLASNATLKGLAEAVEL
jgi:ubiquitin carboxyl-terminal hydrolase L5